VREIDVNSDDFKIGERVREARKRAGFSQERLAEKADVSSRTIHRVENGGGTSFSCIISIASALHTTPNDFCPEEYDFQPEIEKRIMFDMFSKLDEKNKEIVYIAITSMMKGMIAG